MLIERISNPWVKFKVLFATLQTEEEKIRMARDASLYVISNYNAFNFQKTKVLDEITSTYPKVVEAVDDEEILRHFRYFCNKMFKRKEIVSPAELNWVGKYVRNAEIRTQIEQLIYYRLLQASSHWDKTRREFSWTIPESDKTELAREVLRTENIGSKRKMELAQEFGEPKSKFVSAYYKKLLNNSHYNQADTLEVSDPDAVIDVIISNLNTGHFQDAVDIAQRFLPDREDIMKEIQQIVAIFRT